MNTKLLANYIIFIAGTTAVNIILICIMVTAIGYGVPYILKKTRRNKDG